MNTFNSVLLFLGISIIQASYAIQRHRKSKRIVLRKKAEKRETIFIPEVLEMRRKASLGKRSHPAKSCRDIFREVPGAKSGVYWFDIIDKNNRTRQVQYYCKKGDYFEEPNGTFPPENLNAGKAMAEPYDWEELHRETWPSPIDPPDEETMNRKIKQALKEKQKEKNGTKQTEIETPVQNNKNKTAIDLNMDSIIHNNSTMNNGKIKIVRPKTKTAGKRNSINIKILNFKKIESSPSTKLDFGIMGKSDERKTADKKGIIQADSLITEPVIGTKKSLKAGTTMHSGSSEPSKEGMEGTIIKEISAAVGKAKVGSAVGKNDASESEEQSSVVMEVNKKNKIERMASVRLPTNLPEEKALKTTPNLVTIAGSQAGGNFEDGKSHIRINDSLNGSDKTSLHGISAAKYLNNVVSEVEHESEVGNYKKEQLRNVLSGYNTTSTMPTVTEETNTVSDSGKNEKPLTVSTTTAAQDANLSASSKVPVEYGDQLSQHNWPGQINNLLNQLQINSSGDKRPTADGEPLTFNQNNIATEKEGDSPDDIINSTWPLQLGGILQHVMRDFERQRELAKQHERPEDMFAVLLGGINDVSSNSTNETSSSDQNEELAESIIPGDEDTFILNGENTSKDNNDSHSLPLAEVNSILHEKEDETLSSSVINDALNSIPYASYQSRIKRQLENM